MVLSCVFPEIDFIWLHSYTRAIMLLCTCIGVRMPLVHSDTHQLHSSSFWVQFDVELEPRPDRTGGQAWEVSEKTLLTQRIYQNDVMNDAVLN